MGADQMEALQLAPLGKHGLYGSFSSPNGHNQSHDPATYTAREDDNTGLLYYRAHYYDPTLQAFISQDPLGDAQRYAGGNPIGFVDPLGLKVDLNLFSENDSLYKAANNLPDHDSAVFTVGDWGRYLDPLGVEVGRF